MTQTVVITGASAGIGRATARLFGRRGAHVALVARGEAGLAGAARDVEAAGGKALPIPADVADFDAVQQAADRAESELGPIDVWVNVAFTSVFAPFTEIKPGGVQARHRGVLPGVRVRDEGGARHDAAPRPRHDRAGRLRARLPGHPAAVRVLRRQARHQRVHRVGPHRTAARPQQRAHHDRADAGREHAPVLLGAVPAAAAPAAGAADLPARGRRPGRRLRRRPPGAQGVLGRRVHGGRRSSRRSSPRRCSTATWPAPATTRSRRAEPGRPARPRQPVAAGRRGAGRATTARTATSTTGPISAARSCGVETPSTP